MKPKTMRRLGEIGEVLEKEIKKPIKILNANDYVIHDPENPDSYIDLHEYIRRYN